MALGLGLSLGMLPSSLGTLAYVPTYIHAGQSMEVGSRTDVTALPAAFQATQSLLKIWDVASSNTLVSFLAGTNNEQPGPEEGSYPNTIGADYEVGRLLSAAYSGATIYDLKHGVGGSVLGDTSNPPQCWVKGVSGGVYAAAVASRTAFIAALAAAGKQPDWKAWSTDLGYSDAGDATRASNYVTRFPTWLTDYRSDFLTSTTLMIICRMHDSPSYSWRSTVRQAQKDAYDADTTYRRIINMDGLPENGIDIHFSAAGQIQRGEYIAQTALGIGHPYDTVVNPPIADWNPGALCTDITLASTFASIRDATNNQVSTRARAQSTSGSRPSRSTASSYGGLISANFDGTDDYLHSTTDAFMLNNSGGFALFMVVTLSASAANNATVYSEGGAGVNPFFTIKHDGSGNLVAFHRNDAGTVNGPYTLCSGAFDGNKHFIAVYFDAGANTIQGQIDGTLGSSLSFTPGTTTLTHSTIGVLQYNGGSVGGGSGPYCPMNLFRMIVFNSADAALKTKMRTYAQYYHGAP